MSTHARARNDTKLTAKHKKKRLQGGKQKRRTTKENSKIVEYCFVKVACTAAVRSIKVREIKL